MTPSHICEHEHTERLQMSSQQRMAQSRSHWCKLQVHWLSIAPKNSESSVARSSLKGSQVVQSEETHLPHQLSKLPERFHQQHYSRGHVVFREDFNT